MPFVARQALRLGGFVPHGVAPLPTGLGKTQYRPQLAQRRAVGVVWFDHKGALQQGLTWGLAFITQGTIMLSIAHATPLEQDTYAVLVLYSKNRLRMATCKFFDFQSFRLLAIFSFFFFLSF
jgi:hypothetical protein